MSLKIVRLADVVVSPWRNGGGATRELLAWPATDDWSLRISVASIERDGPFSSFPGVQRWLALIDGAGVVLRFGGEQRSLLAGDEPLHFDGAAAPHCSLLGSATQDLNLMLRAGRGVGAMHRLLPGHGLPLPHSFKAVYVADAALLQIAGLPPHPLTAGSLAWSEHAAGESWRIDADAGARAWAIDHQPELGVR